MQMALSRTHDMLNGLSDGQLIKLYVTEQNQHAMRTLVDRHHDRIYSRFLTEVRNTADASDLEQQLWLRVNRHLPDYKDEGKFPHFLSRIATNLLTDYWRQARRKSDVIVEFRSHSSADKDDVNTNHTINNYQDQSPSEEDKLHNDELIHYLITELIPQLPVEQRTAWLLKHESEYWEPGRHLDWQHLATLTGCDEDTVWQRFESARRKLMQTANAKNNKPTPLDSEEILVFIVWTQTQRLRKEDEFTWDYFADLLGVPTSTMKTRYRAAQKYLSEGLNTFAAKQDCLV